MTDDLKPGFYYVKPTFTEKWSVGELADFYGEPHWFFIGDEVPVPMGESGLEIGAYLNPQPGEQHSTATGRMLSTGCGGPNVEASRWTPGSNGEHIYEELIEGKWVRKARLIR